MRSGNWWSISVPGLRGVHSQARRLDQVEDMAREYVTEHQILHGVVGDPNDASGCGLTAWACQEPRASWRRHAGHVAVTGQVRRR
ncbi:hypothetical protein OG559_19495 [Micromonospora sp. NBC_01405]|uniref:type II toxin-antitoxin system HicB family antitoxin n=1 Tax=Micromonospora sp. NBC_01405 TaxID=2903589 RepID=UPI00324A4488